MDMLLQMDVIEYFIRIFYKNYGLGCTQYGTMPSASWDAMLRQMQSSGSIELISNKYLMANVRIQGGLSAALQPHARVRDAHDQIFAVDYNSLFPKTMCTPMPLRGSSLPQHVCAYGLPGLQHP